MIFEFIFSSYLVYEDINKLNSSPRQQEENGSQNSHHLVSIKNSLAVNSSH